jgi:uncharacterized zinc-type alcohol dehydrogenase-like protein
MIPTLAYAAHSNDTPLRPWTFERRDPGPHDVEIDIDFCGICHSDLHTVRGEWGPEKYPFVPGHEIVGHVASVGAQVTKFRKGDRVGVGCMVNSCQRCGSCADGQEQFCENGFTGTYSGIESETGRQTYGGYSKKIVVDDKFVLRIPAKLDPARAAPLLCAGITTYSPLRHWKVGQGKKVGVVGLGGLGHMGIKIARAMGATVVLITTSPSKADSARKLGAHDVWVSTDAAQMASHEESLDLVLDTAAGSHDLDGLLDLLKRDGSLVLVGVPAQPHPAPDVGRLVRKRRSVVGSITGGLRETQEMLDFCAEHGLGAEVEVIPIQAVNEAYERMLRGDIRYRFVIDMQSLTAP